MLQVTHIVIQIMYQNKFTKKTDFQDIIKIDAFNDRIYVHARNLFVVNEFHKIGIKTPTALIETLGKIDPEYMKYKQLKLINRFWNGQLRDLDYIENLYQIQQNIAA